MSQVKNGWVTCGQVVHVSLPSAHWHTPFPQSELPNRRRSKFTCVCRKFGGWVRGWVLLVSRDYKKNVYF